jgi:hypothetical protein
METSDKQLTLLGKRNLHPFSQAFVILILILISTAIVAANRAENDSEWYFAATFLLFFTVANPILGMFKKQWKKYVLQSLGGYAVLFPAGILFTNIWALHGIRNLPVFQLLFLATFIFYFLTLFLVGVFRFLLRLIKSADNNPKYQ